jgi:putative ABC transport system permease protein
MGISIGMASSFLILYFLLFETSYDTFHANANNIYRIELDTYRNGVLENKSALTPPAVGISLLENCPEVENYARICFKCGQDDYSI